MRLTTCLLSTLIALLFSASLFAQDPSTRLQNPLGPGSEIPSGEPASCTTSGGEDGIQGVVDGSFEGGSPSLNWTEASTNFGSPLCTIAGCGTGLGTGPSAGDWWAWFGGTGAVEVGSVTQTVFIPTGSAELTFQLEVPVCDSGPTDFVRATIDGNIVFEHTCADGVINPYVLQTVDVSAFATGAAQTLAFESEKDGSGGANFFIDEVSLCTVEAIIVLPESTPVPTMNIIGLVLLMLALGGLGMVLMRKRSQA